MRARSAACLAACSSANIALLSLLLNCFVCTKKSRRWFLNMVRSAL